MGDKPTIRELINSSALQEPCKQALINWVKYRIDNGDKFSKEAVWQLTATAEAAEAEYGIVAVVGVISSCIAGKKRVLFWDRLRFYSGLKNNSMPKAGAGISREHKESDLERMKREWAKLTGETEG